jgi:hypothetical protein
MIKFVLILFMIAIFLEFIPRNSNATPVEIKDELKETFSDHQADQKTGKRLPLYQYGYQDREHSLAESAKNIGIVYG